MTELYARDVRRNGEGKMPPMPRVYLYPETRVRFPQLPSQTAAALEQALQANYRAARHKVLWTCEQTLPTYRFPTPYPVPAQGWSINVENERLLVSVRVGDERIGLVLRGGPGFRRQRQAIEHLLLGAAVPGELSIYQRKKDVMVKMVTWLPRNEASERQREVRSGTLTVRTDAKSIIIAVNAKDDRLWTYHGDHIRRWSVEHRAQLQRWADDQKAEHCPTPPFSERRRLATQKYHHRMASAAHQIAAMIAGYAQRRRFNAVRYDDSVREFCPGFPWFRLHELIGEKLDAAKIVLEYISIVQAAELSASISPARRG